MHELPATPWPASASVTTPTDYPVRFVGTGSEYFRIWIVNLLLTIVTFGIYSAWAKVRRLKYMYRNTQIAESSFDYHGSPIAILKGRLIALVLLIAYNFSFEFSLIAGVITLTLLAAIFPWLIRQSLRFRARYSSYRGIHFQFIGGLTEIYLIAAPLIFFIVPFALLGFYAEDDDWRAADLAHRISRAGDADLSRCRICITDSSAISTTMPCSGSAEARFTATAGHFYARLWNPVRDTARHRHRLRRGRICHQRGSFQRRPRGRHLRRRILVLIIGCVRCVFCVVRRFRRVDTKPRLEPNDGGRSQFPQQRACAADGAHLPGQCHLADRHARFVHPLCSDSQS